MGWNGVGKRHLRDFNQTSHDSQTLQALSFPNGPQTAKSLHDVSLHYSIDVLIFLCHSPRGSNFYKFFQAFSSKLRVAELLHMQQDIFIQQDI